MEFIVWVIDAARTAIFGSAVDTLISVTHMDVDFSGGINTRSTIRSRIAIHTVSFRSHIVI